MPPVSRTAKKRLKHKTYDFSTGLGLADASPDSALVQFEGEGGIKACFQASHTVMQRIPGFSSCGFLKPLNSHALAGISEEAAERLSFRVAAPERRD
jgi:hypothetical protein